MQYANNSLISGSFNLGLMSVNKIITSMAEVNFFHTDFAIISSGTKCDCACAVDSQGCPPDFTFHDPSDGPRGASPNA